jgi:hypothetical protein
MVHPIPRRRRLAFTHDDPTLRVEMTMVPETPDVVDFVAYGADCVLSGRTVLDGDRLSDMLNDHHEYTLTGVRVEPFDGGRPFAVDDVVVSRDEIWMVHAGPPRGAIGRRTRTAPRYVAIKMGPYQVRGFIHALPGSDALAGIGRRRPMIPVTSARVAYTVRGEKREARAETVIVNRDQMEWLTSIEPDGGPFPPQPTTTTTDGAAADFHLAAVPATDQP